MPDAQCTSNSCFCMALKCFPDSCTWPNNHFLPKNDQPQCCHYHHTSHSLHCDCQPMILETDLVLYIMSICSLSFTMQCLWMPDHYLAFPMNVWPLSCNVYENVSITLHCLWMPNHYLAMSMNAWPLPRTSFEYLIFNLALCVIINVWPLTL